MQKWIDYNVYSLLFHLYSDYISDLGFPLNILLCSHTDIIILCSIPKCVNMLFLTNTTLEEKQKQYTSSAGAIFDICWIRHSCYFTNPIPLVCTLMWWQRINLECVEHLLWQIPWGELHCCWTYSQLWTYDININKDE